MSRPQNTTPRRLPLSAVCLFLYIAGSLTAFTSNADESPKPSQSSSAAKPHGEGQWPLFRGNSQATGVAQSTLPASPKLIWKYRVPKGAFEGTPVIADGIVYIGDLDGHFFALELSTGKVKWERKLEAGFIAAPAVRKNLVYAGDLDGVFHCFDTKTGKDVWKLETEAEIDAGANFYQDNVLFGSQDATLYCVNGATGKLVWKHMIEDQIRCSPTIVDKLCFVAGCDAKLHAVNVETGKKASDVDIMSPTGSTPAVSGHFAYFGTEGGEVLCVDWKDNTVAWRFALKRSSALRGSPAVTDDLVLIGGRDKRLHAINIGDGQEKWSYLAKHRIDSSPVVVGSRVFFGSSDGALQAVDTRTGKAVWTYEAGGGFIGSPAVAENRLVIANENGVVYCFGESAK